MIVLTGCLVINNMKKCINFIAYNRPEYFSQVLNSWKNTDKINEYDLYFFIDYSDKTQEIKNLIREFIKKKINASKQKIKIITNNPKKGVNNAMYNALSYSFDKLKYDFVVMAEDDIVVTKDSLRLLECMLHISEKEKNIAIFNLYAHQSFENVIHNTTKLYKICWFNAWGWATTNKNWTLYIKKFWSFDYSMGWDIHITENIMKKQNLSMIVPKISRSKNIGVNGTHATVDTYNNKNLGKTQLNTNFEYRCSDLEIDTLNTFKIIGKN